MCLGVARDVACLMAAPTPSYRHHPQDSARQLLASMLEHRDALRPADVAATLSWLASFGVLPGKASAGRLASRLEELLGSCSTPELCSSLWSMALLGETGR